MNSFTKIVFIFTFLSFLMVEAQVEIDADFGVNGTVNTNFLINRLDEVNDIFILENQSFFATGSTGNLKNIYDFGLAKYLSNGQLDATFGNSGILTIDYLDFQNQAYDLEVLSDGNILVMGIVKQSSQTIPAIVKLNSVGKIDSTFGNNGWWIHTPVQTKSIYTNRMLVDTDGSIYITGYSADESLTKGILIHISKNGILDTNFGNNGLAEWGNNVGDAEFSCLAKLSEGKIVVGGSVNNENDMDILVCAYDESGNLVNDFGVEGSFILDFGVSLQAKSYEKISALTVLKDHQIRLGGYVDNLQTKSWDFLFVALDLNGVLVSYFGENGIVTLDFDEVQNEVYDLTHDDFSNLYFTGYYSPVFNEQLKLVGKINSNGELEDNFGNKGVITHQAANSPQKLSGASVVKIKGDKLYLGGSSFNGSNYDFSITRWKNLVLTHSQSLANDIFVYPNPFSNYIYLNSNLKISLVKVYSLNGVLVSMQDVDNVDVIDLSFLNSGVYILEVYNTSSIERKKIIKN